MKQEVEHARAVGAAEQAVEQLGVLRPDAGKRARAGANRGSSSAGRMAASITAAGVQPAAAIQRHSAHCRRQAATAAATLEGAREIALARPAKAARSASPHRRGAARAAGGAARLGLVEPSPRQRRQIAQRRRALPASPAVRENPRGVAPAAPASRAAPKAAAAAATRLRQAFDQPQRDAGEPARLRRALAAAAERDRRDLQQPRARLAEIGFEIADRRRTAIVVEIELPPGDGVLDQMRGRAERRRACRASPRRPGCPAPLRRAARPSAPRATRRAGFRPPRGSRTASRSRVDFAFEGDQRMEMRRAPQPARTARRASGRDRTLAATRSQWA